MKAQPIKGPLDDPWSRMMTASIAGDDGAYRRLLEDIGRSVRAMARAAFTRARVGDADIEDAVQETLLAIHLGAYLGSRAEARSFGVRDSASQDRDTLRRRGTRRIERSKISRIFSPRPSRKIRTL